MQRTILCVQASYHPIPAARLRSRHSCNIHCIYFARQELQERHPSAVQMAGKSGILTRSTVPPCLQPSRCNFAPLPVVNQGYRRAVCRAAAVDRQSSYPYNSGDDKRQKATIEHIFRPDTSNSIIGTADRIQAPWAVGWQMNERNIMWNDDLKLRLIKRVASQEMQVSEEELEARLQQLTNLLPDMASRLVNFPPKHIAQLALSTDTVAARLLRLRQIFPQADASAMVGNRLSLLLDDDLDEVESAAARLRQLLPQLLVDKFVESFPMVLDVDDFTRALQDAKRIMPGIDVPTMLRTNPDMILSLQKGKSLIPYDQIENPWS